MDKIEQLSKSQGYNNVTNFLGDELYGKTIGSGAHGICETCDYVTYLKSHNTKGWCPDCKTNSVVSATSLI